MAGENEVVLTASGFTSVTIWCTKLDHNFDKPLFDIQIPRNDQSMTSQTKPATWIVDIGRVKEIITVQGMLIDETTESALTKKWNLIKLMRYSKAVTISWGTGNNAQTDKDKNVDIVGNINKVMFTETAGIIGSQQAGYYSEKNFAVQFGFIVGTAKN